MAAMAPRGLSPPDPGLMAMRAWVELVRGEMRLDLLLTQAETALARRRKSQPDELYRLIEGQIETIWAALWRFRGDPQRALSHARRALDLLESAGSRWVRGSALAMVAFGLAATDQVEPAVDAIDRALTTEPPDSPAAISLIYSSMVLRLAQGQPAEAVRVGAAARDAGSASAGYVGYSIRSPRAWPASSLETSTPPGSILGRCIAGRARAHVTGLPR